MFYLVQFRFEFMKKLNLMILVNLLVMRIPSKSIILMQHFLTIETDVSMSEIKRADHPRFTYRLAFCKSRRSAEQTTFTSPRTMYLPREMLIMTFLSESHTLVLFGNRAGKKTILLITYDWYYVTNMYSVMFLASQ